MAFLKGLRIRLLALVLVAVVPTFGLLIHAGRVERQRLLREARENASDRAQLVAEQHQRAVDGTRGLLLGLSRMAQVREFGPDCSASLATLLAAAPIYANAGAVLSSGDVYCSAFPAGGPVTVADRPFVRGALKTGQLASGEYALSRVRGVPVIAFGYPVQGEGGGTIAVAFASLKLSELQRQLDDLPLAPGLTVAVVDRGGVTLTARPDPQSQIGKAYDRVLLSRVAASAAPIDLDGPDGIRRVYASAPVLMPTGELAMRVVVGIPSEDTYGPVNLSMLRTFLAFLAVAVLALAGAALAGEYLLVRRIKALIASACRIARGDYTARSGIRSGGDELGDLVGAFDQMAHSLETLSGQKRLLLDAIGEGIVGTGPDGRVVFANPAAAQALGWRPEEMLGKEAHELLHPTLADGRPRDPASCTLLRSLHEGVVQRGQDEFRRKDGSCFPAEFVSTPMHDGTKVVGAVLAFRDVSDRHRLEEQLRHAHKMEALGQFSSGVAHDFNNLLTAILTCGRFLQDQLGTGHRCREDADIIVAAGERAATLTRQLLALGRRQRLDPHFIDLADAVRGMQQMITRVLGEGIEVLVDVRAPGAVEADPSQLELLLLNLVANSRDAMPDGGRLAITVEEIDRDPADPGLPPGPLSVLSVQDTGTGIGPDVLPRIFEPFFTTKGPGKGTGLGLATAYGFVSQSGGAIRVRSRPGEGTEIRAYLPRRAAPQGSSPTPHPDRPAGGNETVLVVEDDDAIRALTRRTLSTAGYAVLDAESPSTAISKSRGHPGRIDLLLSDVLLPERNGRELSRELLEERPNLRVLFMSGYAGNRLDGSPILPAEALLLAKPFTAEELLVRVREALDAA